MKLILKAKRSGVDAPLCTTTFEDLFGKYAFFWNPNEKILKGEMHKKAH